MSWGRTGGCGIHSLRISLGAGPDGSSAPQGWLPREDGSLLVLCPLPHALSRTVPGVQGLFFSSEGFSVRWTRSGHGSDLKANAQLLQELLWLMQLHPFSPKSLELAKASSLKQRNCETLLWKWVLGLSWGRKGERKSTAWELFSPPAVSNLFTFCSISHFPWQSPGILGLWKQRV